MSPAGRRGGRSPRPVVPILKALERIYGRPRPRRDGRLRPLDELIATILSQNTTDVNSDRAWEALKRRYRTWDAVLEAPRRQLESTIRVGGLAPTKSRRIREALRKVRADRGRFDLDFLADLPAEEAEAYLRTFKGVGLKTIRCVLLFSCGKPVFPVDTHIFRVGKRLGLLPAKATPESAHEILQRITPPREIHPFHVNLIRHGRRVCKARRPLCDACAVARHCDDYRRRSGMAARASPRGRGAAGSTGAGSSGFSPGRRAALSGPQRPPSGAS